MKLFVFLHIATMFSAVAIALGPEWLMHRAARSGDVPTIRGVFGMSQPLAKVIPAVFILGLIFGLIAVFTGGFDPLAPWLLLAYVLFIVAMLTGGVVSGPWQTRVYELALKSAVETPSEELAAALHERRARAAYWLSIVIVVLIIFDMVIKPFS